jgi:hypothetical protein
LVHLLEPLTSTDVTSEKTSPRIRVHSDAEPPDWHNSLHEENNYSSRPAPFSLAPTSTTSIPTTANLLGEDENGYLDNQDEHIRQILGNFAAGNYQVRNSSTTSLASTAGGSEYQYPIFTPQDEYVQQDILQQQQQQLQQIPFPFSQFLNPLGSVPGQQHHLDLQSKLWQFIHFGAMILLGCLIIWNEYLREKNGFWERFHLLSSERPEDIDVTKRIPHMVKINILCFIYYSAE